MNLTSVINFCMKYWKELLMAVLLLSVIGKFRYDYGQLEKAYEATQQSLQEQIAGLKALHQQELERKEKALENYKDAIDGLEEDYRRSKAELKREKNKKRAEVVNEFSGDKTKLAEEIQEVYGFAYVP